MLADDVYRVMVVDDSAVVRGLISRTLEAEPNISVVASVANGELAISALRRHEPDVVVLDIEMPVMDGLTALPKLLDALPGVQVIMASTLTRRNADVSLEALEKGAADYVPKPSSARSLHSAEDFRRELVAKVLALGERRRRMQPTAVGQRAKAATPSVDVSRRRVPLAAAATSNEITLRTAPVTPPDAIAIGSSTGGPQSLLRILGELPAGLNQPILITQHMPATFTALLAEHLDRASPLACKEAADGEPIVGGTVYVAPGDTHLLTRREGAGIVARLSDAAPENFCRPAVDPMLRSMSSAYGSRLLALILTGMGSDGKRGAEAVAAAGGTVVAQDEASSVVWGMPGAVATAGLCTAVLSLVDIAPFIRKCAMRTAA